MTQISNFKIVTIAIFTEKLKLLSEGIALWELKENHKLKLKIVSN
jgi:hypothetical protein